MYAPTRLAAFAVFACALLSSTLPAGAVSYFVTPAGAGASDGSSWLNAAPETQLQTLVDALQPGDEVLVGSGTYTLSSLRVTGAGLPGSPKSIAGVDTGAGHPVFQGTFDVAVASGGTFLQVHSGAHHWTIRNLVVRNHRFPVALVPSGTSFTYYTHLTFENIACDSVEDGFKLFNASDILLKNCSVVRHTKKAFRISDYSRFIRLESCYTDCTGGDPDFPARAIPNGFFCDDTGGAPIIHDITFVDCTAVNNSYPQSAGSFWNGDGFSSERGAYNITYIRCKAYNNVDAGFDNKAESVTYQDCVAAGNSRGFRHWGGGGVMTNCVSVNNLRYGGTASPHGLWVSGNGGVLSVSLSTFHNAASTQISAESGAAVTVADSIISTETSSGFTSGPVTLTNSATWRPGEGTDPLYVDAGSSWRGTPVDGMDSRAYGTTKGYHSARAAGAPNAAPTLSIQADTLSGTVPFAVQFTADGSDSDGMIVSYQWQFGNGQVSGQQNPSFIFQQPGEFTVTCTVTDNGGARTTETLMIVAEAPTVPVARRIEAGSGTGYTDTLGNEWAADFGFGPGGGTVDRGLVEIANTDDDRIYQTERWGVSSYAIVVANGLYEVKLHFAETFAGTTAAGQRVFDVTAEGATPAGWSSIDVFAESGGSNRALIKSGVIEVQDNVLNLGFTGIVDKPLINGIEILPVSTGDTPPAPVAGLTATNVSTMGFSLSWSPASDDGGVVDYEVRLNGDPYGIFTATATHVTGLSPDTMYRVTVQARDAAGNVSAPSDPLEVRTEAAPDLTPPSPPTGLQASSITATGFSLAWNASTDDVGVTGYEVSIDGLPYAAPATTSVNVVGRTPLTTYEATVVAVDAAGNRSQPSAPLAVTTADVPPTGSGGDSIGVNLTDPTLLLAAADVVGAVPAANWNNSTANNQTLTDVIDSTGATTTTDLAFNNTPFLYQNTTPELPPPLHDDALMMRTQRARSNANTTSVTASEVPYAVYDVYVYWGGRAANQSVPLTMGLEFQQWNGAAWVTTETKYIRDTNRTWSGVYSESTASTADEAAEGNDYVVFRNVTDSTFRITTTAASRAGMSGLQIVSRSAPPPPSPVITSATSADGVYGSPFEYLIVASGSPTEFAASGLPTGLTLDAATGEVSGVPLVAGDYEVELRASNASGSGTAVLALTIAPAAQSISFPSPGELTYGDDPVALNAVASSGLPVSYAIVSGPATLSGNLLTLTGAGTVKLSASQAGDANFLPAASVELTIEVARAPQTLSVVDPGPQTFGGGPVTLSAVASSGLSVAWELISGPGLLVGNTVTLTGAGTIVVEATQSGDADYLPAQPVELTFLVNPAEAEVQLAGLWQLYDGVPKPVLVTTSPAGLAVTVTYDGNSTPPTYPGRYAVEAVVDHPNYTGTAEGKLLVRADVMTHQMSASSGAVAGSAHLLTPESVSLSGRVAISGDLLVPGTPQLIVQGSPEFGSVLDGPGSEQPVGHAVTLAGHASLRNLVRRVDPMELPEVTVPELPSGGRDVHRAERTDEPVDFDTLRHLTLSGAAGEFSLPPGTYGAITLSGQSTLVLGETGATEPAVYQFQSLSVADAARVHLAGPAIVTVAGDVVVSGRIGADDEPEMLMLRIAEGRLTLNGDASAFAFVECPHGTVSLSGTARLVGGVASEGLTITGNAQLLGESR